MEIIFIPGLICTNTIWGEINDLRKYYICHDADVTQFDTIEKMSINILHHLPSDEISIIGFSMGGYVAIDLAIKLKNRLKKLILINTTYKSVDLNTIPDRFKAMDLVSNGKFDELIEMSKGCCYFSPKEESITLQKEMAKKLGANVYIQQQKAIMNRANYSDLLKYIQSETLIIASKNDQITSYKESVYMFEQIPSSNLVLLDKCGHLSTLEKGNYVFNAINTFLKL